MFVIGVHSVRNYVRPQYDKNTREVKSCETVNLSSNAETCSESAVLPRNVSSEIFKYYGTYF